MAHLPQPLTPVAPTIPTSSTPFSLEESDVHPTTPPASPITHDNIPTPQTPIIPNEYKQTKPPPLLIEEFISSTNDTVPTAIAVVAMKTINGNE